jgi:hypothetical protein
MNGLSCLAYPLCCPNISLTYLNLSLSYVTISVFCRATVLSANPLSMRNIVAIIDQLLQSLLAHAPFPAPAPPAPPLPAPPMRFRALCCLLVSIYLIVYSTSSGMRSKRGEIFSGLTPQQCSDPASCWTDPASHRPHHLPLPRPQTDWPFLVSWGCSLGY